MAISDIRTKVLSGQVQLQKQALWVDRWGEWVEVRELSGAERAALLKANMHPKTGQVNIGTLYPHLAIVATHSPSVDCEPEDVEVPVLDKDGEPVLDANGEPVTKLAPPAHLDLYPSLEERQSNQQAGALIFQLADRDALNETSGAALEQIGQVAARLSGLMPDDIAKKNNK